MITAHDLLAAQPFLAGLSTEQLDRLSRWSKRAVLQPGNRVLTEGARADRFWLIREGKINLVTQLPGRGEVVLETLGPNSVLGWSWLFSPYRWHFSAVATEPTLAVELDGAGIRHLCKEDTGLGYELTLRFTEVLVGRLQSTRMRLLDLYAGPAT